MPKDKQQENPFEDIGELLKLAIPLLVKLVNKYLPQEDIPKAIPIPEESVELPPPAKERTPSYYRKKILEIAEGYLGRSEEDDMEWVASINRDAAKCTPEGACWLPDSSAWCGSFVGHVVKKAGLVVPKEYFRASEWAGITPSRRAGTKWGRELASINEVSPGDLIVSKRKGGYHVAFVHHLDNEGNIYIIGGNQSDRVSIIPALKPIVYLASPA